MAAITAIEPDHLEIYESEAGVYEGFNQFAKLAKNKLFVNINYEKYLNSDIEHKTYGINTNQTNIAANNIIIENQKYVFDLVANDFESRVSELTIPGKHNIENFLAAFSIASQIIEPELAIHNLGNYKGVVRRFEILHSSKDVVYIDDYAHHPTEISVTLQTISELYAGYSLLAVFQPHLYSRTNDFKTEFAEALSIANEVLLLPIYPAREEPLEGVSSSLIANQITTKNQVIEKHELIELIKLKLQTNQPIVIVTLGAGDIDTFREPIRLVCQNEN